MLKSDKISIIAVAICAINECIWVRFRIIINKWQRDLRQKDLILKKKALLLTKSLKSSGKLPLAVLKILLSKEDSLLLSLRWTISHSRVQLSASRLKFITPTSMKQVLSAMIWLRLDRNGHPLKDLLRSSRRFYLWCSNQISKPH